MRLALATAVAGWPAATPAAPAAAPSNNASALPGAAAVGVGELLGEGAGGGNTFNWVLAYKTESGVVSEGSSQGMDESVMLDAWGSCNVHFAAVRTAPVSDLAHPPRAAD